jgi:hypothetical protein
LWGEPDLGHYRGDLMDMETGDILVSVNDNFGDASLNEQSPLLMGAFSNSRSTFRTNSASWFEISATDCTSSEVSAQLSG